jgi:hypothetical protein
VKVLIVTQRSTEEPEVKIQAFQTAPTWLLLTHFAPPTDYIGTPKQFYSDLFTPAYLQGKNTTITIGFSFGF